MNEVIRQLIVEEMCTGCSNVIDGNLCFLYEVPASWHRRGGCPASTVKVLKGKSGKKINPLKASKRRARRGEK